MMMKKIFGIVIMSAIAIGVMAVPARRGGMIMTAADGTEKMVYLHGNEDFHYMTDADGNWLDEETLEIMSAERKQALQQAGERRAKARRAAQQKMVGNLNLAPRGLIIMVNFKDQAFVTPRDTVDSMMNSANYRRKYDYSYDYHDNHYEGTITSSGSARKYFQDQSYGQYNPVFDIVGPYTVSGKVESYGKNNSSGSDSNVGAMIKEACELADQNGADFTLYDNDNDGYVDFVYVLYAGEGEADGGGANTIWPHNYKLNYWGKYCSVDGKQINNYACSNEINHYGGSYTGIGTFCHEFSHVIGLPDMYETNNPSKGLHTLIDWDILDYGCYNNDGNTPPAYSAYERFYCGWLTPRVLTEPENVTLQTIDSQEALLVCDGDQHNLNGTSPDPQTFYLLEARNQEGWDKYLPGEGLMITRIMYDYSKWWNNSVNNVKDQMGVDMMEAKTNNTGWGADTDLYPKGATEWTGLAGHEVTNITRDSDGKIHFVYRGGTTELIETTIEEQPAVKILRNGRVVIVRGGKVYDILGYENHQL